MSSRLVGVILVLLVSSFIFIAPAHAAEGVTINTQVVRCDSIDVTYTVTGGAAGDTAQLSAYTSNDQLVGSGSGPGSSGQHTVTIPVNPPQAPGTLLFVYIQVGGVSNNSNAQPCGSAGGPQTNPWNGYYDGRLNPAEDEYYSIWCRNNQVEIWRSVPDSASFLVPLIDIYTLADGGTRDIGNNMTVTRSSNMITVYGSNGNLAPAPGSKNFSLSECVTSNGGVPEQAPTVVQGSAPSLPANQSEFLKTCAETYTDLGGLSYCLYTWVTQFCLATPAAVVIIPTGMWAKRRLRRSKR